MNMPQFWTLIESARVESGEDCEQMAEILVSRLSSLPVDEILEFQEALNVYLAVSYKLGSVFSLITGCPMSDDSAEYFCMWLIKQGRVICEAAWTNPDVLADLHVDEDQGPDCEAMLYVAWRAYRDKTGSEEMPILANDARFHLLPVNAALFPGLTPDRFLPAHESREWKEWSAGELKSSCPKLWARFHKID
jgi:Protein of unknown function (DUF4240)